MYLLFAKRIAQLACLSLLVTACSKSDKVAEVLPPTSSKLHFTYEADHGTLYQFDPIDGKSSTVENVDTESAIIRSEIGLMLLLDTDQTNSTDSFDHTPSAEYALYAEPKDIFLYDMELNREHHLISQSNLEENQIICDIEKVRLLDEKTKASSVELIKDEIGAYVKVSNTNDCTSNDFSYFQLITYESEDSDETFTRQHITLDSHDHISTHYHTGVDDGHSHDHNFEDGQIDTHGNIFDSTFHPHTHTHSHDLNYAYLEEHDHLSQEEIDKVHDNVLIRTTEFRDHPIIKGTLLEAEEAIMYSSRPIFFKDNDEEFGYLGYSTSEDCLKFFLYAESRKKLETVERQLIWSLNLSEPSSFLSNDCGTNDQTISTQTTPLSNLQNTDDGLLFSIRNKLYELPLTAIYDDDETLTRALRIRNPIHQSDNFTYNYSHKEDTVFIQSTNNIYANENPGDNLITSTVKAYSTDEVDLVDFLVTQGRLYAIKERPPGANNYCTLDSECALVEIRLESLQEETQLVSSNNIFKVFSSLDDDPIGTTDFRHMYIHQENIQQNSITAYSLNQGKGTVDSYNNAIWADLLDLRKEPAQQRQRLLARSATVSVANGSAPHLALDQPNIYIHKLVNALESELYLLGKIPTQVAYIHDAAIIDNYYGYITVATDYDDETPLETYFFPTGKSFINPAGEFGDMKLMRSISTN